MRIKSMSTACFCLQMEGILSMIGFILIYVLCGGGFQKKLFL